MKKLLSIPWIYESFQKMVGVTRYRERYVREHLKVEPKTRILDIGCGPGDILHSLPETCHYVGIDLSREYIQNAQKRFGNRAVFICCPVEQFNENDVGGAFDLVMANGVLHHLSDEEAKQLFRLAAKKLQPNGRFCSFDGCFTSEQSKLARWLLKKDRGLHVRERPQYEALASTSFQMVKSTVLHDTLRIPYTHCWLECRKPLK